MLINIDVSLLNQKKVLLFCPSVLCKKKKIKSERNIRVNKKINIYNPLSGSLAKVCTEFKIPDLTKKVPLILKVNVAIDKTTTHEVKSNFFSNTSTQ